MKKQYFLRNLGEEHHGWVQITGVGFHCEADKLRPQWASSMKLGSSPGACSLSLSLSHLAVQARGQRGSVSRKGTAPLTRNGLG